MSHIREFHLESAPSDLNPHLYVSLRNGRVQLSTAHAIYSFEDLYDNFGAAFKLINWTALPIHNVLVLGGGLLSVPYLLDKYLDNLSITVVEYDEQVIYLASKYMLDRITASVQMIHADAAVFVEVTQEIYDLIIVDVFDDDFIPEEVSSIHFLQNLKELSHPQTTVLYNRLSRMDKDLTRTKIYYHNIFKSAYPNADYFDVDGNWILTNRSDLTHPDG